jgi:hypothetical protein
MNMRKLTGNALIILLATTLLVACASRYRRDLYLVHGQEQSKVRVEKTEYVIDGILGTPLSQDKVIEGPGNCVILTTGSRGEVTGQDDPGLVDYNQYLRYKIFLQLPSRPHLGKLPLENNSFVQLLGYYELPVEEKTFIARSGEFSVDSLTDKHLFGSIDGSYRNYLDQPVAFRGEFKVKITR